MRWLTAVLLLLSLSATAQQQMTIKRVYGLDNRWQWQTAAPYPVEYLIFKRTVDALGNPSQWILVDTIVHAPDSSGLQHWQHQSVGDEIYQVYVQARMGNLTADSEPSDLISVVTPSQPAVPGTVSVNLSGKVTIDITITINFDPTVR